MTPVRSYYRGKDREKIAENIQSELRLEPILRQLDKDIQDAMDEIISEFPELKNTSAWGRQSAI